MKPYFSMAEYHEGLNEEGVEKLLQSGKVDKVLTLMDCKVTPAVVKRSVAALARLEELTLSMCYLGPEGAKTLGALTLPALRRLDLSDNQIGLAAIETLSDSPLFATLDCLNLSRNVTEPGQTLVHGSITGALCQGASVGGIKRLWLHESLLDGSNTWKLFDAFLMKSLKHLDVRANPGLAKDGLVPLRQSKMRLEVLRLDDCGIDDAGIAVLAESASSSELRELGLSRDPVSAGAINALIRSPHLARLERLDLSGCKLNKAEINVAAAANPKLQLVG